METEKQDEYVDRQVYDQKGGWVDEKWGGGH